MKSPLLLLMAGLALPGWAQHLDEAAERARISAERGRVEADFGQAQQACYARFAVSDCIAAARSRRRDALADLRRQEVTLNDAERRRRAEERLRDLESRQSERQQRDSAAIKGQEEQRNREQREAGKSTRAEKGNSDAQERAAKAARPAKEPPQPDTGENLRRHRERVEQAQEHKAKVEKRAAEPKRQGVRPLPVPP